VADSHNNPSPDQEESIGTKRTGNRPGKSGHLLELIGCANSCTSLAVPKNGVGRKRIGPVLVLCRVTRSGNATWAGLMMLEFCSGKFALTDYDIVT